MQSVEMIPFGLLAGFVDDKEVRITEISTESFCFRVREKVERPRHIRIGFYDLSESMYREVELESYHFMEKRQEQWYVSYTVEVFQQDYVQAVQKLFREYTGYIRARIEGTDGEMAQITCNYPANQDEIHAKSMEEQKSITNMGGTMRLGAYECILQKGSKAYEAYGTEHIQERHRHRYEFNNQYKAEYEAAGMKCVGINPESDLVEIVEIPKLKWFVGTQFHPEYSSTVLNPHPLFVAFIKASVESFEEKEKAKK